MEPTRHLPAGRSTRPHEFGWLRAVDQLGTGPERIRALAVGGQLVAAGVLALFALAALPRLLTLDSLAALEDLLLAAGLAVSARSTALAARRTVWWDSYPVAQLSAVVVLALAGLVGAGGPAVSGLAYVLLVVSSAPYLRGLRAAVVVAGCSAGHLAALVVHEPGPGLAQRWLALTGVLLVVTLLAPAHAADRTVLHDLVHLEVVDRVTGLVTTPYLDQAGRHAAARTARSGPISVVAARIEGLDELTREHGHDVVDMALERLAARLQGSLRPGDVLAKTAPDELVALLPNADADAAEEVAGALRACAGSDVDPAIVLVTGVASAQPRHPAGRVADLVARARAQRPSRQPGRQPGRQPAGG